MMVAANQTVNQIASTVIATKPTMIHPTTAESPRVSLILTAFAGERRAGRKSAE